MIENLSSINTLMIQLHIHLALSVLIAGIIQKYKAGRVFCNIQYTSEFFVSHGYTSIIL